MAIILNKRNIRILGITTILLFFMFFIVHQRDTVDLSNFRSLKYQNTDSNSNNGFNGNNFKEVYNEASEGGHAINPLGSEEDAEAIYVEDSLHQAEDEAEHLAEMEMEAMEKEQYGTSSSKDEEAQGGKGSVKFASTPDTAADDDDLTSEEDALSNLDPLNPTFIPPYPENDNDDNNNNNAVKQNGQGKSNSGKTEDLEAFSMEFDPEKEYEKILRKSPVVIFSKTTCPYSMKLKELFKENYEFTPEYYIVEVNLHPHGAALREYVGKVTERTTVPNVIINGVSRGGFDDMKFLHDEDILLESLRNWSEGTFNVDRIITSNTE